MFLLIIMLVLLFMFAPPVTNGRAFNSILRVSMPNDGKYGDRWNCILAQEIVEFWTAWIGAIILALPFIYLLSLTPFFLGAILVPFITWKWRTLVIGEKFIEYIGHGAEILHGHKLRIPYNIREEATSMIAGYRFFNNSTVDEIVSKMKKYMFITKAIYALSSFRIRRAHR